MIKNIHHDYNKCFNLNEIKQFKKAQENKLNQLNFELNLNLDINIIIQDTEMLDKGVIA